MIWKVRVEKLSSRRMLAVTFFIIFTGFLAWFPSIIANFGNINMNYEVSQILTVTLFYLNSVTDPVIYILGYPSVKSYIRTMGSAQVQSRHGTCSRSSCVIQSAGYPIYNTSPTALHANAGKTRRTTSYHHSSADVYAMRAKTPNDRAQLMCGFGETFTLRTIPRRHSAGSIYTRNTSIQIRDMQRIPESVTLPNITGVSTIDES